MGFPCSAWFPGFAWGPTGSKAAPKRAEAALLDLTSARIGISSNNVNVNGDDDATPGQAMFSHG
jgi:hypothetical protein